MDAAAPEVLVGESVKSIGTMLVQTTGSMMEFPGSVPGSKAISNGRGWYCPERLAYENDCLKIAGACSTQGSQFEMAGSVEFKACLRETALGLAGFSGGASFHALWDLTPSCVRDAPDAACHSSLIKIKLTNPSDLMIRFAESDSLAVNALQVFLEETWRMANYGAWRMTVIELQAVSKGRIFQCSGNPVICAVGPAAPEAPPPQPLNQACLDIPDSCDSDQICQDFFAACPETAELLRGFGHELRCLDNQSRGVKSCLSRKIQPPDEGGDPPSVGVCSRNAKWGDYCPMTSSTTINGEGLDCTSNAPCQTRLFAVNYGNSPCNASCFTCQFENLDCEACDVCLAQKHICVTGCCAVDEDQDGYVNVGFSGGSYYDQILLEKEDNCLDKSNPDQADSDSDCLGDVCDNCPQIANGYGQIGDNYGQGDIDQDGAGDACDNCPLVPNGPNPTLNCNDKGCVEVTLPPELVQKDSDGDGVGDVCQGDYDGDGVPDGQDNCPRAYSFPPSPDQSDGDGDGVGDFCDNCRRTPNSDQTDVLPLDGTGRGDGRGDACQEDWDEDGFPDKEGDNCPFDYNPDQANADEDPFGDICDYCPNDWDSENTGFACAGPDFDGDGVPTVEDNCPKSFNPGQEPFVAGGGFPGAACSWCLISESPGEDSDGDGLLTHWECDNCQGQYNPQQEDSDGDLIGDACDNCPTVSNWGQRDSDNNGQGDACISVCGNGVLEAPFEACDDENLIDGDGCDSNCTLTACGNEIVTEGETCEEKSQEQDCAVVPGAVCTFECFCKVPLCGDAYPDVGETCDDGNTNPNDDCTDSCVPNVCGDGIPNPPNDVCEPGSVSCKDGLICTSECLWQPMAPSCGDSCLGPDEVCDDGNTLNGDGCDSTCSCACEPGNYCDADQACQSCEIPPTCTLDTQCMDIARQCGAPPHFRFICEITDGVGNCVSDCTEFETNCHDGIDNDCDGLRECVKGGDPDCEVYDPEGCGIRPPPAVCGDRVCDCQGGENPTLCPEDCTNEIGLCQDGIDNDCDGLFECVAGGDPDCPVEDAGICPPSGCNCDAGNYCDANQACQSCDSPPFSCDTNADCVDIASQCGAPSELEFICVEGNCAPCAATETDCSDGIDNDCDGNIECTLAEQDCYEIPAGDPKACPPPADSYCGDGACNGTEDCIICPTDCTKCIAPPKG